MELSVFKEQLKHSIDQSDPLDVMEKIVFEFFRTKPIPHLQINQPFLARARFNENGGIFSRIDQLSYNPDTTKIKLQRANYDGQQVFYGELSVVQRSQRRRGY